MGGSTLSHDPVDAPNVETRHRRISSPIPHPETAELMSRVEAVESRSMHGQLPVIWDRAEGFTVTDPWGNRFIDFTSTIFVTNVGHANPKVVRAIQAQLDAPLLHTYTYLSPIRLAYLERLTSAAPDGLDKAFLLSAGTEATECALKLMRMYAQKTGRRRRGLLCVEGNWHGRTMGAQLMCSNEAQRAWIGFTDPDVHHVPFPYPWRDDAMDDPAAFFRRTVEALLEEKELDPSRDLCGIMLETFQGWGAVFYPPKYVQEMERFARAHDLVLTFDEMQSGFGRTGELFGYMHYGVTPDLLCLGKGAASSVPLSAVLGRTDLLDLPDLGAMSSTHSANPISCAAGLATLEVLLDDGMLDHARTLGEHFHARLRALQERHPRHIRWVLGEGLLSAVHFVSRGGEALSDLATEVCLQAMRRGLILVHTGRESIKMAPPLCITREALDEGVDVFIESVEAALGAGAET